MLNSHPKWMSRGRFSFRMSIENRELNIGQILPSYRLKADRAFFQTALELSMPEGPLFRGAVCEKA